MKKPPILVKHYKDRVFIMDDKVDLMFMYPPYGKESSIASYTNEDHTITDLPRNWIAV